MCTPRRYRLIVVLAMVAMLLVGAPTAPTSARAVARSAPRNAATAADVVNDAVVAPQFLGSLPDVQGLIAPGDAFIVGGGYVYWSRCRIVDSSGNYYLRRWPLNGGRVATLVDGSFCGSSAAADDTGLYYWDNGTIYRRSTGDPFTAVAITSSPQPTGPLVLNNNGTSSPGLFFWVANNVLYGADRYTHHAFSHVEPWGNNAHSLLVSTDLNTYFFADGVLKQASTFCLVYGAACVATALSGADGDGLIDASAAFTALHPLWVNVSSSGVRNGDTLMGYGCSATSSICQHAWPLYTAPARSGSRGAIGPLATDGTYLFWVENSVVCSGGIAGCSASATDGRLMKWKLNSSSSQPDPFDTPQPIVNQNGGATFTVNTLSNVAVANGWVYFTTSNGLARVRADAPPLSWTFAADSYEVTQGIQNLTNDVPLVADKPTFVRFYGRKLAGPDTYGVEAILYGTSANGSPLLGSPLHAINGSQDYTANNADPNRADSHNGWLFQLPPAWVTAGTIKLSPVIDPRQVWSAPDRSRNSLPFRSFAFTQKAPICIVTIPVRTNAPPASNTDPSVFRMADVTHQLLPTNDVGLYHQDDDIAQFKGLFKGVPFTLPKDNSDALNALHARDKDSDDPDRCINAGAVTHYVGLVSAATNTNDKDGNEQLGVGYTPGGVLYTKLIDGATLAKTTPFWQDQDFETLAHELGHNYGRLHVDCGDPADIDPNFPYVGPSRSGTDGPQCVIDDGKRNGTAIPSYQRYYGFDTTSLTPIDPTTVGDLMSYNATFWMSDYTWHGLFGAIASSAATEAAQQKLQAKAQAEVAAAGNVVSISGSVDTTANAGTLDYAWVYPTASLSAGIRAKLQRNAAPQLSRALVQDAGSYTLRLRDAAGTLLDERAVTLEAAEDGDDTTQSFALSFPAPAAQVARLELTSNGAVIATLQPGASAPTISILNPAGGETIDDQMTLSWRASDPDAHDKLLFTVQYSPDKGAHWRAVLTSFPSPSDTTTLNLTQLTGLPGSTSGGLIRVAASDGYNTAIATSKPFTVTPRAPVPHIDSPGSTPIPAGQPVIVRGGATDVVDGDLRDAALFWKLNGIGIGTGTQPALNGLAPGSYTLALAATNAAHTTATVTSTFTVAPLVVPQVGTALALDGLCTDPAFANAASVSLAPYSDQSQAAVRLVRSANALWACFTGMKRTGGSSPGTSVGIHIDTTNSRDAHPQAGDLVFSLGEDGTIKSAVGNGSAYIMPGPVGASGQVSANGTIWTAELRIDASVFGGWNRVVGLAVEQDDVNGAGNNYVWPSTARGNSPNTWATTALGDIPAVSGAAPNTAPAGSGDTTVTITGSGFGSGATVLWNSAPRATTVVSSTQVQVVVPAADLANATLAQITVAAAGMQGAPSNALPFTVMNPAPHISQLALSDTTLTVKGTNFVSGATVIWNGQERPTTLTSGGQLQTTLNDSDLLDATTTAVTVFNPGPGGGVSNIASLGGGTSPPGGSSAPGGISVFLPLIRR